jgi:hypothetical protein
MSEISFRQIELAGPGNFSQRVIELVSEELGGHDTIEELERFIDYGHGTIILGGFVSGEMVCMNAFMPMRFSDEKRELTGYQSGFSATSLAHRGKGYWPKLLIASEGILAAMGGSFVFGFPNEISHPLFVKKLGYTTVPMSRTRIALIPGVYGKAFQSTVVTRVEGTLRPDVPQHIAWKKRSSDDQIVILEDQADIIWGKIRTARKSGLQVKFLEIGSVEVSSGSNLKELIKKACYRAQVRFCYMTFNHDNEVGPLLHSKGAGQPAIVKGMGNFDASTARFNLFGGLVDNY